MSLAHEGRRRLNSPQTDLYRESQGTKALAKRRIPTFRQPPLKREATIGRFPDGSAWADAEAGPGRTQARIDL